MEQKNIWRNLTGTAYVVGLAVTTMSFNSTQIIGTISEYPLVKYGLFDEQTYNSARSTTVLQQTDYNNVYLKKPKTKLEREAIALFGYMREATSEESRSVNNYINSISKETGVNFFDLC